MAVLWMPPQKYANWPPRSMSIAPLAAIVSSGVNWSLISVSLFAATVVVPSEVNVTLSVRSCSSVSLSHALWIKRTLVISLSLLLVILRVALTGCPAFILDTSSKVRVK